jgi:hypothetical protein
MNGNPAAAKNDIGQSYFLSEIIGAKVILRGKKVGNLGD